MSQEQLAASATRAVNDLRAYGDALDTKTAIVTGSVAQSDEQLALTLSYVNRLEAAKAALEAGSGGGTTSPVFAFIDFDGVQADDRPTTWANKAQGGLIYNNYGPGRTLGGKADIYGPYVGGKACYSEGASDPNSANVAIVSQDKVTVPNGLTLLTEARLGSNEGPVFSFTDNGLDTGPVHILCYANARQSDHSRSFTLFMNAFGISETMTTDLIPFKLRNNEECHDPCLIRNPTTNKFEFRANEILQKTSTNAFVGTLVGYHCAWGNFRQGDGATESPFRGSVGFMYGSRDALYSGATYTTPPTRPVYS